MATIGTFTVSNNGFSGSVKTLTLNVKATFVATEKENDKAPDYRIVTGATEFASPAIASLMQPRTISLRAATKGGL